MRLFASCNCIVICAALGCGGAEGAPPEGPLAMQSTQRLSCAIDSLVLDIPIELFYELDRNYAQDSSSELTFSAAVVFEEATASALIDAGVSTVDIVSMRVATSIKGASPPLLGVVLTDAPINDFDLEPDTNDDGLPGPHRLELAPITVTSEPTEGATQVEMLLSLSQVLLRLGDFEIPADCVSPALAGPAVLYPVASSR
jgi:hypothetical protein